LEVDLILWVANFRPSVRVFIRPQKVSSISMKFGIREYSMRDEKKVMTMPGSKVKVKVRSPRKSVIRSEVKVTAAVYMAKVSTSTLGHRRPCSSLSWSFFLPFSGAMRLVSPRQRRPSSDSLLWVSDTCALLLILAAGTSFVRPVRDAFSSRRCNCSPPHLPSLCF